MLFSLGEPLWQDNDASTSSCMSLTQVLRHSCSDMAQNGFRSANYVPPWGIDGVLDINQGSQDTEDNVSVHVQPT